MSWRPLGVLLLVGWGAFAFGAVYSWAYVPLFAGCAVLGSLLLAMPRSGTHVDRAVWLALAVLIGAVIVQVIPWPHGLLQAISPNTDGLLKDYEVGYAVIAPAHALSISPMSTLVALMGLVALAILLAGLLRGLNGDETRSLTRGIIVTGAVLSVAGIIQKGMWNGKIYGVWTPMELSQAFGPFVNRNHFAGWMLMALPVAVAYFCGLVARGTRLMRSRSRIEALGSADASEALMVGFAIVLMIVSMLMTKSRSGVLGLCAAMAVGGWLAARRKIGGVPRAAVIVLIIGGLVGAARWVDVNPLLFRFVHEDTGTMGNRLGVWADTWHIAQRFPLAGTGLNTYWIAMLYFQTVVLDKNYLQAHSDYLQLLSEGGALICLPALVLAGVLVYRVRQQFVRISTERTDYWIRIGAVTGIAAIALQEIGEFSLQMPGNAVLLVVLIALAIRQSA